MILPVNKVRILIATSPVDFRKGHHGLAALVQSELLESPFSGTIFIFRSKRQDRLKLLYWDGCGLVMTYKCLEDHHFCWPEIKGGKMQITPLQFEALFAGLDWRRVTAKGSVAPMLV